MDIAALVKDARRRAGLTIRQLAQRAGTSHSAIAAYESGAKAPNTTTFARIIQACGFRLGTELVPRGPFEDRTARGKDLVEVLELAERFPTVYRPTIAGRFPSRSS